MSEMQSNFPGESHSNALEAALLGTKLNEDRSLEQALELAGIDLDQFSSRPPKKARQKPVRRQGREDALRPVIDKIPEPPPSPSVVLDQHRDRMAWDVEFAELQQQLQEKEQLIVALTDRLEQAAEQLDRQRRTGADRGRRGGGTGFAPELMEDHRSVLEDLKQVIGRWEDMQAATTLGRLESQVADMRDLLTNYVKTGAPTGARSGEQQGHAASHQKASSASWWESQKASLLGLPPGPETAPSPTPAVTSEDLNFDNLNLPDLPLAVDYQTLTLEEAQQAIRERDQIITQLHEPLVLLQAQGKLPKNLNNLQDAPEAVKQVIQALEAKWEQKFRQAELDLSLERARVARAQAALSQQQEQSRADSFQNKRQEAHDSPPPTDEVGAPQAPRRRWFSFLAADDAESDEA